MPPGWQALLRPRLTVRSFSKCRPPRWRNSRGQLVTFNWPDDGFNGLCHYVTGRHHVLVFLREDLGMEFREKHSVEVALHELAHAVRGIAHERSRSDWKEEQEADELATSWAEAGGRGIVRCASIAAPDPEFIADDCYADERDEWEPAAEERDTADPLPALDVTGDEPDGPEF